MNFTESNSAMSLNGGIGNGGIGNGSIVGPLPNDQTNMNEAQIEEINYYKGLRFLLLARAYESQENKLYAV